MPLRCLRSLRQEAKEQRNGVCVCVRAYEGKGERSEMERGRENGWERTRNERCFWCMRERERERSNPAHSCVRICVYICVCVCVCVRGGVRWWESERERGVKRVSTIAVTRSPLSFSLFLHLDPPPLSAIPFPPAALILLPHTHTHTHTYTEAQTHTRSRPRFFFYFSILFGCCSRGRETSVARETKRDRERDRYSQRRAAEREGAAAAAAGRWCTACTAAVRRRSASRSSMRRCR